MVRFHFATPDQFNTGRDQEPRSSNEASLVTRAVHDYGFRQEGRREGGEGRKPRILWSPSAFVSDVRAVWNVTLSDVGYKIIDSGRSGPGVAD